MMQSRLDGRTQSSSEGTVLASAPLVLALCLGQAVGASAETTQPIWVAAILKSGWLTASQTGWLASAELFFVATGALAVSLFARRTDPRALILVATLLVAVFNAVALGSGYASLVIGRLLSGIGSGMLLALVLGIAVRRELAQRLLAGMQLTVVLLAVVLFLISPNLIDRFGQKGLFGARAVLGVAALIAAAHGVPHMSGPQTKATNASQRSLLAPLLISVAIAFANCAFTTIWTFIVTIGTHLGFSGRSVSHAVALAQPAALIAPAVATILGDRMGIVRPMVGSLVAVAAATFLLLSTPSVLWFCAIAAVVVFGATFYVPYALNLLGHADTSGSIVSAVPVTFLLGASVGPTLGAHLLSYSFRSIAAVSTLFFLVPIPLLFASKFLATRERES
jgi:predicted MFS family arabinose efflux permease